MVGIILRIDNLTNVTGRTPDETIYTRQTRALLKDGVAGHRAVVSEYLRDSYTRLFPPPTRIGYLSLIGVAMRVTGLNDETAGSRVSIAASIGSLLLVALFGLRYFRAEATLFALLFFIVSPLELELARRTWSDALAGFIGLALVYLTAEITHNSQRRHLYLLFGLLCCFVITVKESGPFVFAICMAWLCWVLARRREWWNGLILIAAVSVGVLAGIALLAHYVGGVETLAQIVTAIFRANATNPYALEYQSGPSYWLIASLWIVSPLPTILCALALIALGVLQLRRGTETDASILQSEAVALWVALFFLAFFSLPLLLPHWLNLRYVSAVYGVFYLLAGYGFHLGVSFLPSSRKTAVQTVIVTVLVAGLIAAARNDYIRFRRMYVKEARGDLSVKLILDFRRLVRAEATVKGAPTAESYVSLCERYNENWRYGDAVVACEHSLKLEPDSARAYMGIASAHVNMTRWDDAIAAAQKALRIKPDDDAARKILEQSLAEKRAE